MNYTNNIIFLDIDGVLTSLADGSYFSNSPENYHPSKTLIERVKNLAIDTKSKIVFSSNWRKFAEEGPRSYWNKDGKLYKNPLPYVWKELGDLVLGTLPLVRHITKSDALKIWFNTNASWNGNYVILDDDLREGYQDEVEFGIRDHFVHTNYENGLTTEDCDKAKEILKNNK